MKNINTTGFLEERPGVKSSERLKSIATLLFTFALIWGYLIYKGHETNTEFNFLIGLLLVSAFTPTTLKKIAEIRTGFTPKTTTKETSSETSSKTVTENP